MPNANQRDLSGLDVLAVVKAVLFATVLGLVIGALAGLLGFGLAFSGLDVIEDSFVLRCVVVSIGLLPNIFGGYLAAAFAGKMESLHGLVAGAALLVVSGLFYLFLGEDAVNLVDVFMLLLTIPLAILGSVICQRGKRLKPVDAKRHRRRVIVTCCVIVVLVTFTVYGESYARARRALDLELSRISQMAEPRQFSDLALRDGDSKEDRPLRDALSVLAPLPEFLQAKLDEETLDLSAEERNKLRDLLNANGESLDELCQWAQKTKVRFSYEFDTKVPSVILLPHVQQLNTAHGHLAARWLLAIHADDSSIGYQSLIQMFNNSELLRHEPFLVSQLVRSRLGNRALDLLELTSREILLTPKQTREMAARLMEVERHFRLEEVVATERAIAFTMMDNLGSPQMATYLDSIASLSADGGTGKVVPFAISKNRWWGSFIYRPQLFKEQRFLLSMMSEFAANVDKPGVQGWQEFDALNERLASELHQFPVASVFFVALGEPRERALAYRQRLICAHLALCAHEHFHQQGTFPDSLESIINHETVALATGLFSDRQLCCETTSNTFTIYDILDGKKRGEFTIRGTD